MTYQLPKFVNLPEKYDKVTDIFTRMAIYLDLHIRDEDKNDELLYRFIYHLCYMLACKKHYFNSNFEMCDKFGIFCATRVYLRALKDTGSIKSLLNYIKSTLYPMKVDFQKESFNQIVDTKLNKNVSTGQISLNMQESIQADYNYDLQDALMGSMKSLTKHLNKVIKESPYSNNKKMRHRLYMSILLTIDNSITLPNTTTTDAIKDVNLIRAFKKEREEHDTILWHLPSYLKDYVELLARKVINNMGNELLTVRDDYQLSIDDINDIILSAYGTEHWEKFNEEF